MGRSLFTHLVILQAFSLGVVAWAGADRGNTRIDRGPAGLARMESQQAARIDIQGTLKCPQPESNTGEACQLSLTSSSDGKILRINESSAAMRLFHEGKTEVVAEGTIQGDSLRIIDIKPAH